MSTTARFYLATMLCVMLVTCFAAPLYAHGTKIDLNEVDAVEIHARFDNGDPMVNAQINVYAPTDRAKPWLQGEADENGYFFFVPDNTMTGQWDVQVRTAGHGDWVYIEIGEEGVEALSASGGSLTMAQIAMMSAAVIWGFIGTALYFMRPKGGKQSESESTIVTA